MVTNFFVRNFLRAILVGEILNLLIKSQPLFVHRRTRQSVVDTILRLKVKIVPTVQKQIGYKIPKSSYHLAPNCECLNF